MIALPRRRFCAAAFLIAVLFPNPAPAQQRSEPARSLDLMTASVADIQAAVAAGTLTYERLIEMYLARIEAYQALGLIVNPAGS